MRQVGQLPRIISSKMYARLKKIMGFQKGKPVLAVQKFHARRKSVQDTVEIKFGAVDCENRNMKGRWNIFEKCLLSAVCDVGKLRGQQGRQGLYRK